MWVPASARKMLAVLVLAIILPVAWVIGVQFLGPSDGTLINVSVPVGAVPSWQGGAVTVDATYDQPALQLGDRVTAVDGRSLDGSGSEPWPQRQVGDRVIYRVIRDGQLLDVHVDLQPFPLALALSANLLVYALPLMILSVAIVVYARRPGDPAARQMLLVAPLFTVGTAAWPLGLRAIDLAGGRSVWPYLIGDVANCLMWAALLHFALVFPEPVPALVRHPRRVAFVYVLPFALGGVRLLATSPFVSGRLPHLELLAAISDPAALGVPVLVAAALVYQYRQFHDLETRRRLRWVIATLVVASMLYVGLGQAPAAILHHPLVGWQWLQLSFIACPLAIAAAILRYRLFDIELIAKRSLVYGGLTVGLLLIYLAALAALGGWFPKQPAFVDLVAGALVALCFHPLHRWLGRRVSRIIYGSRDDPYEVVSELGRVEAAGASGEILGRVADTLAGTLRLSSVVIELHRGGGVYEVAAQTGIPRGRTVVVPLTNGDDLVGRLQLDVPSGRELFGPADRRLLEAVARQVSAVARVVLLNAALQRSRERLITAREEERRRLRRDLHDGIGPTLAAQSMQLEVAWDLIDSDSKAAKELIGKLTVATKGTVVDIRRLVDDLRPPALDQMGLVSAIRERTAYFTRGDETGDSRSFEVEVLATEPLGWLPAAVEVAAFRIAVEAVTNAARHANATACTVALGAQGDRLIIQVEDNGRGLPSTPRVGVGLTSMRERATELGGTFSAQRGDGVGTVVRACIPLSLQEYRP
jgi:two-component system NarL family sensor kinase